LKALPESQARSNASLRTRASAGCSTIITVSPGGPRDRVLHGEQGQPLVDEDELERQLVDHPRLLAPATNCRTASTCASSS
jgi:hypothetical protein